MNAYVIAFLVLAGAVFGGVIWAALCRSSKTARDAGVEER